MRGMPTIAGTESVLIPGAGEISEWVGATDELPVTCQGVQSSEVTAIMQARQRVFEQHAPRPVGLLAQQIDDVLRQLATCPGFRRRDRVTGRVGGASTSC